MSVTLHFQSTGTVPGNAQPFRMLGGSMTIGRTDVNDLVLPDPEKVISGRHCSIEDQGGNVVVIDLSTNGTFLNYGKLALGKTPTPLNNGDILSIGSYELMVKIAPDEARTLAEPLPEDPVVMGVAGDIPDLDEVLGESSGSKVDFIDELLGGSAQGPAAVQRDELGADGIMEPLGEEPGFLNHPPVPEDPVQSEHGSPLTESINLAGASPSAIPDDWDLDLPGAPEGDVIPEGPFGDAPAPMSAIDDAPDPEPAAPTPPPQEPAAPLPAATAQDTAAARAFLTAFGAEGLDISDADLSETMARLGGVMNTLVAGVRSILMTRQSIKSEFRINQTVISAGANNPLKFSVSVEQAVEAMARPQTKGYLPAAEAAQEAMDDIAAHEVAMMTGMEAALKGVLAELAPTKLSERIDADKSFTSLLSNKKARYWDVFETQFEKISDQAENDFHDLFSKAFADAYQAQLERLKK